MEQVPGAQSYNCNANDVRVASVAIKQLRDASGNVITPDASGYRCSEGETLFVDFTATIENGASSARFDNAVWWRFGGDTAKTSPDPDCAVTSFTKTGLLDLDGSGSTADVCGDLGAKTLDTADVCGLKILCEDPTGSATGATVKVASCTAYRIPGANLVCNPNTLATLLPGSPSKCKCELTTFPISIDRCTLEATCLLTAQVAQCENAAPPPVILSGSTTTDTARIDQVFDITSASPCGGLTMSMTETSNGGTGCSTSPLVKTRTYTLNDDVGRTGPVTCVQTITIKDETAPTFGTIPAPLGPFECPACTSAPYTGCFASPAATDNCPGTVTIESSDAKTANSCGADSKAGTYTRTWTATDRCGLFATATQAIVVQDTTPPVITGCPASGSVNFCGAIDIAAPPATLSASDTCGTTTQTFSCCFDSIDDKSVRTWTVADLCSNTATCVQNVGISATRCA